ncbi:MAG: hypothetical protein JWR49_3855 [Tardiphaga sp.]|nr:hypothetical protein [Tardiphaga sp.]
MPLVRYLFLVGSILVGILCVIDAREKPVNKPAGGGRTSLDTLRAMAHHGEPEQRAAALVFDTAAESSVEVAAQLESNPQPRLQSTPATASAQARMNTNTKQATREVSSRKLRQRVAIKRLARGHTVVAEADRRPSFDPFGSPW